METTQAGNGAEHGPFRQPPADASQPADDAPISHTICARCYVKETAQVERIVRARRRRSSA